MTRRPAAPGNLRNGLKWRDGRPRWEPSPASRKAGIGGMDLKGLDGQWLGRGAAIDAADARSDWARIIREAAHDGAEGREARADLVEVLSNLTEPQGPEDRLKRQLVADLIALARTLLGKPELDVVQGGGARSVNAMIDAYFVDPVLIAGPFAISASTRKNYTTYSKRIREKMGHLDVVDVTRGFLRAWYVDICDDNSVWVANGLLGATSAFFKWAIQNDWLKDSPATKLGRRTPKGRRVFWTTEEELSFLPFCDANGFEDVADAATMGLWTAARSMDMCLANVEDLAGDSWRFVPHKTKKTGRDALPGLTSRVKDRVSRRRAASAFDKVRAISATPFLYDVSAGQRHTTESIGKRFREAKAIALLRGAVPESFAEKRLQDTRDTCVTRLYEADVKLDKIPAWTGHSPDDRDNILREHYVYLREAGALDAARRLAVWAAENGLAMKNE